MVSLFEHISVHWSVNNLRLAGYRSSLRLSTSLKTVMAETTIKAMSVKSVKLGDARQINVELRLTAVSVLNFQLFTCMLTHISDPNATC